MDISADEIISRIEETGKVLFAGPGLDIFLERISDIDKNKNFFVDHFVKSSFCNILSLLGEKKFHSEGSEPPEAGPSYLRASDAELGR